MARQVIGMAGETDRRKHSKVQWVGGGGQGLSRGLAVAEPVRALDIDIMQRTCRRETSCQKRWVAVRWVGDCMATSFKKLTHRGFDGCALVA